ncbi:formylmethanofuran dehydrogenase [Pseudodesulfovibrio sp. F-1]|uniref:Formylmethanofuran dehydrogenase n=1 Tax=Pseudodesulfovibrio alkaliphilus TaxID=2661613 RepID=A0A7K1KP86_9BACT|nr:FmdE family protein [Pseudodesulfovibrio alkaliphilus]MUM77904.1 formylmethanofuran dehydrogenase [Pseudodesulfovibrio alkaliphilus]
MPCHIPTDQIAKAIDFHGHECPGLHIGIRAAELALRELGHNRDIDLVAVCETDMCGVDAIQSLTGCTFGKGNLIHRDLGKMAFSFFDRGRGIGLRALLAPEARSGIDTEMGPLMGKVSAGKATEAEEARLAELRTELQERFLALPLEEMFAITRLEMAAPRPARILTSHACERCGEMTMESRTRRLGGQTLCIPCFAELDQKI